MTPPRLEAGFSLARVARPEQAAREVVIAPINVGNGMIPASLEGQTLGKYRVLEPLGRGGMARVYRAYHPQLDRYVAIKVLRSDLVEDEEFLTRFRREAQAVAALRHANIVQVYDFDVEDSLSYMVMELLEGDTLKARLSDYRLRGERMPLGDAVRILLDVLDGLAYAHSEGMIHRDVKPANILLTRRGQAVVSDFGIAQIVGSTHHTATGALMGTLSYMAPEQGLEGQSDARSDIYSLGIVLYEMLTQRTPYDADTPLAVLMKHLKGPLPLPRQVDPSVPEPFERVVLKALAKEPDDRYQSAEAMARALREAAEQSEVELPERISLPLSFKTAEAPSESVAVFSGTARGKIAESGFSAEDTDPTLGERLAAERAAREAAQKPSAEPTEPREGDVQTFGDAGKQMLSAMGALGTLAVGKTARALRDAVDAAGKGSKETSPESEIVSAGASVTTVSNVQPVADGTDVALAQLPEEKKTRDQAIVSASSAVAESVPETRREAGLGKAILIGLWIVIIANLLLLWVAGLTGWWSIFEKGWPLELFLVSLGFSIVMAVTGSVWLLIPSGILLGSGIIFAYSSLTGNWEHWVWLWGIELLLIVGTVWLAIWLERSSDKGRRLSRSLGWLLGLIAAGWSFFVPLLALIYPG